MKKEVAVSKKIDTMSLHGAIEGDLTSRRSGSDRAAPRRSVRMSTGTTIATIRSGEHYARPCYGGVMPAFAPSDGLLFTCHCGGGSTFVGADEIEKMIATMKGKANV